MEVAELVEETFRNQSESLAIHIHDVADSRISDMEQYQYLILGTSTYKSGDLEPDWEYFFNDFKNLDLTGKKVALFGLGNSLEYADTFASGMGILAHKVLANEGQIIGKWPTKGYDYDYSFSECDKDHFYGLILDQDYEAEMSEERVSQWVEQIIQEINDS